ncbi:hypothetical protein LCGC14_2538040, partial [marine sediment metagenome]
QSVKLANILCKLSIEELILLLGEDFKRYYERHLVENTVADHLKLELAFIIGDVMGGILGKKKEDTLGMPINQYSGNQIYFLTPDGDTHQPERDLQNRQIIKISTLDFINKMIDGLTKISPKEYITTSGKSKGKIKITVLSKKFFGFGPNTLRNIIRNIKIRKYPNYLFAAESLDHFIEQVNEIFGKEAQSIIDLTTSYRKGNPSMRVTIKQQWQRNNPDLKVDYFNYINTKEKAYWFGWLFAEGWIENPRPDKDHLIGVGLNKKDEIQLQHFIKTIGFNPKYIRYKKDRVRTKNYEEANYLEIGFQCLEFKKSPSKSWFYCWKSEI